MLLHALAMIQMGLLSIIKEPLEARTVVEMMQANITSQITMALNAQQM